MKMDTSVHRFEGVKGIARFMNDVIVEHHVDGFRASVGAAEDFDCIDEEFGVFAGSVAIKYRAGTRVQGPGDIVFDVLAGREHKRLLTPFHIGQSDARIEIDIRFIKVEYLVARTCRSHQLFNVIKDLASSADRNAQGGARSAPATAFLFKQAPNVAHAQRYARIGEQLTGKKFERPYTALPIVIIIPAIAR